MTVPVMVPLKTTEGTLTILLRGNGGFKPRGCSVCGHHIAPRYQSHRHASQVTRCRMCVCRENGFFRNWLCQNRQPQHYDEDAVFHDGEEVFAHWLVEKATVKLTQ